MSEWIDVKDRLPDDCSQDVLVVNSLGYMETSTWTDNPVGGGWCVLCRDKVFGEVTHWMPLPPPPVPKLTVKEALREAVTALEHMFPFFDGYFTQSPSVIHRYGELMPRLRAALESE
jgi:hypothetical protein